jgi:hypothetical protein
MLELEKRETLVLRQLRAALGGLFLFVLLGVLLEAFHAFKWMGYLHVQNETRRMLLRLAHAHGTVLSLMQLGFALAGKAYPVLLESVRPGAMLLAQVLIPLGFLLGAIGAVDGDPGPWIAFLPAGALALLVGLGSSVWVLRRGEQS